MRIVSFNVNGIRAILKKSFKEDVETIDPDILCLQETKAQDNQVAEALVDFKGYHLYTNSAVKKGYSGTAILTKTKPLSVSYDLGIEEHDQEGRLICAEFESYFVITTYVPNSKNDLSRLDDRQNWDAALLNYLLEKEKQKPVILCGDLNVAHRAIDLARPKENYNKSAGFTQEEINGLDNFTEKGFTDSFRALHPETVKYSWWSYRGGARERNVGWRIDYFLVSEKLMPLISKAQILNEIYGSDHCPVAIELKG